MEPKQLSKFMINNGRLRSIFLRRPNQFYEASSNCSYSRNAVAPQPLGPFRSETKTPEQRCENQAPIRRLRAVKGKCTALYMQTGLGGSCVTSHLRGDQGAALAAAANSKSFLEAVMGVGRQRSQSTDLSEYATDHDSFLNESKLIFGGHGLRRRSLSAVPNRTLQPIKVCIESLPRNQQSARNNRKFDFGDHGLMPVDANLKKRLLLQQASQSDPVDGAGASVRFEPLPVVHSKASLRRQKQCNLNLSNQLQHFQHIQFADGPVSNANFIRHADQQQQQQHQQQQEEIKEVKRDPIKKKLSMAKAAPPKLGEALAFKQPQKAVKHCTNGESRNDPKSSIVKGFKWKKPQDQSLSSRMTARQNSDRKAEDELAPMSGGSRRAPTKRSAVAMALRATQRETE